MDYEQAMAYIKNYKSAGISLGLERMRELCSRLDYPQQKLSFIHIAGTNGKGSTAAYISSILGVNGYLTERYVSPVVFQYEECIQFEDSRGITFIDRQLLAEAVTETAAAVVDMEREGKELPTIFEFETAISFVAFVKRGCQIVVLEAGLGGREDATNVIGNVVASVITPVGRDHMKMLGDTVEEIAREKAGIIREGVPVISFQKEKAAAQVIASVCEQKRAPLISVCAPDIKLLRSDLQGSLFSYQGEHFRTQMTGVYQIENACLAIETCRNLGSGFSFDEPQLMVGIRAARWRGRFEVVNQEPLVLVDGAHNESGARALRESVETLLGGRRIHGVMGVFGDKEYNKIIEEMRPVLQDIVAVRAPADRGLEADVLAKAWRNAGCADVMTAGSVKEGLKLALQRCGENDAVVIFGSLSLLGELTRKQK